MKIYFLNGTTALGASKLIVDTKAGNVDMNYKIEVMAAADQITGAIISGDCAIAALPTNAAANLYKKSGGKVQLLAINTLGVLYLLNNGETVTDFNSLRGKTIYLPGAGSNPEYITAALLASAGVNNVTLDTTTYPNPDALHQAIAGGLVKLAVLPEPNVTAVTLQNSSITVAIDLTQEWEKINGENTLLQGCLVVNTEFAKNHPAEIKQFLKDYKASVDFIAAASDEAINMIVDAKILPAAPMAKKALPKCNICCITGEDMISPMNVFFEKIYAQNPDSIKAIPDNSFYYVEK
jgi:NitT/TauT family transport system substrate-binding protein